MACQRGAGFQLARQLGRRGPGQAGNGALAAAVLAEQALYEAGIGVAELIALEVEVERGLEHVFLVALVVAVVPGGDLQSIDQGQMQRLRVRRCRWRVFWRFAAGRASLLRPMLGRVELVRAEGFLAGIGEVLIQQQSPPKRVGGALDGELLRLSQRFALLLLDDSFSGAVGPPLMAGRPASHRCERDQAQRRKQSKF